MRSAPSSERAVSAPAVVSPPDVAVSRRLTVSFSQRTLWMAAGVALVAVAAILVLTHALGAVLLIFFAIILAEAIRPLVAQLERLRVPRPLGALVVYLALALIAIGIGWLLFNPTDPGLRCVRCSAQHRADRDDERLLADERR
jgi:hypothetical protein